MDFSYKVVPCCREVFSRWLQGNEESGYRTPVSWQTVIECFRELELNAIAKNIEDTCKKFN